jgi:hypothetical protein
MVDFKKLNEKTEEHGHKMERDFISKDIMGGQIIYNRPYTKKDGTKGKAGVSINNGQSKWPVRFSKDQFDKLCALKEDQDFMREVYPYLE